MKTKTPLPQDAELEQFKQEWYELAKKYAHLLSKDTHFHATYFNEVKNEVKRLDNSHHKSTPKFKIVFDDGRTIPEQGDSRAGSQVLGDIIRFVGAKQVFDACILTVGKRIVVSSDFKAIEHLCPNYVENGWWVITKTSNPEKIKTINEIIQRFNLNAKVERVMG